VIVACSVPVTVPSRLIFVVEIKLVAEAEAVVAKALGDGVREGDGLPPDRSDDVGLPGCLRLPGAVTTVTAPAAATTATAPAASLRRLMRVNGMVLLLSVAGGASPDPHQPAL